MWKKKTWLCRKKGIEVRKRDRGSQGQRVIRLFLSDEGNCQALGMKSDYIRVWE